MKREGALILRPCPGIFFCLKRFQHAFSLDDCMKGNSWRNSYKIPEYYAIENDLQPNFPEHDTNYLHQQPRQPPPTVKQSKSVHFGRWQLFDTDGSVFDFVDEAHLKEQLYISRLNGDWRENEHLFYQRLMAIAILILIVYILRHCCI